MFNWAVACGGLVMPGTPVSLYAPLTHSSTEQWRVIIVIVTRYALFVTSQYDVIFTFGSREVF